MNKPPSVIDLIKAGMGKNGRYRAVSSEGSELEIHVDLTGQLVLTIGHNCTTRHWAIDKQPEQDPCQEIAICRIYNEPKTRGTMACAAAIKTATGVWVCCKDFHLDLAKECDPHDCEHKDIRTLG